MIPLPMLSFLMAAQAASAQVDLPASADCRPIGEVIHCFNPPPSRPADPAEFARAREQVIAQERRIMAPLAAGASPAVCEAVQRSAAAEGRPDLELAVRYRCNPELLQRSNQR
jgi:hypothetical protein